MSEKKMILAYHTDLDGECAASIVKNVFRDYSIKFFPTSYASIDAKFERVIELLRSDPGFKKIFIVDISFSLEQMRILSGTIGKENIVWIDHHKTAIEKLEEYKDLPGIRSDGTAACVLTWKYLCDDANIPNSIKLIEDYDLWKFHYGSDTKYFHEYMSQFDTAPWRSIWLDLQYPGRQATLNWHQEGKIIYEYKMRTLKKSFRIIVDKTEVTLPGDNVSTAVAEINSSDIDSINYLADIAVEEGYPVCIIYYFKRNKENRLIRINQIRSRSDIDVSEYAKSKGGGGHKNAAGWVDFIE